MTLSFSFTNQKRLWNDQYLHRLLTSTKVHSFATSLCSRCQREQSEVAKPYITHFFSYKSKSSCTYKSKICKPFPPPPMGGNPRGARAHTNLRFVCARAPFLPCTNRSNLKQSDGEQILDLYTNVIALIVSLLHHALLYKYKSFSSYKSLICTCKKICKKICNPPWVAPLGGGYKSSICMCTCKGDRSL